MTTIVVDTAGVHLLRDVLARIVRLVEALADGDCELAALIAHDLEADLARLLGVDRRPFLCRCGFAARWPGELENHRRSACGFDEEVAA